MKDDLQSLLPSSAAEEIVALPIQSMKCALFGLCSFFLGTGLLIGTLIHRLSFADWVGYVFICLAFLLGGFANRIEARIVKKHLPKDET